MYCSSRPTWKFATLLCCGILDPLDSKDPFRKESRQEHSLPARVEREKGIANCVKPTRRVLRGVQSFLGAILPAQPPPSLAPSVELEIQDSGIGPSD